MSQHTSFKIGGPADILVTPEGLDHISKIINIVRREGIPFIVIGNGSNLVVRDKGIRGIVIKTFKHMSKCYVLGEKVIAQAGALMSKVASLAYENELTGLEFAAGIPGTIGGAVTMNAGAYGPEMKDVVFETTYLDLNGSIKVLVGEQHKFAYRSSAIQQEGGIVLETVLKLKKGNMQDIKQLMEQLSCKRREAQPLEMPSAGSVFRRPQGHFTGKLIEDSGLKGYSIGGAQVSTKHCGFIVNTGAATAEDIVSLIKHIQVTVKANYGVDLITEVKIIGEG
jgi:UDP-N-acetylmuramate dehydrogenase